MTSPTLPDDPQALSSPKARQSGRRRTALIAVAAGAILTLGAGITAVIAISSQQDNAEATGSPNEPVPPPTTPNPASPRTTPTPTPEPAATPPSAQEAPAPEPPAPVGAGIDDPQSITVVINKQRPFSPLDWRPSDLAYPEIPSANGQPLRHEAAVALERMYAEAHAAGVPFALVSGFRDFGLQTTLFNNYAASYGVEAAETFSARPGYSEHQTGLVADISECLGCPLSEEFGATQQGQWVRANAHRFGFILRYDQGAQPVVGYMYEPWHFRYVGVETANDMHFRAITTLEEYFGLPAASTY